MLFNVAGLLREPIGSERHYVLEPDPPVHGGSTQLIRTPDGVLVRCQAEVVVDAACSRCLAPFGYRVPISFEEVFHQQVDVTSGHRLEEVTGDPEAFLIRLNHTIDITEAVRQYSEMAAVMQPLCREDCPGLCPACGKDLTVTTCSCDRAPKDPRWAALAAVLHANG